MTTFVIGFCGAIEADKTTSAKFLQGLYKEKAKLYSFADALKEEVTKKFNIDKFQVGWTKEDDWSGSKTILGRQLLQDHGAEVRKKDYNHWLDIIKEKIEKDKPALAIVQDMRYINELEWVKGLLAFGKIIYVKRDCMEERFINEYIKEKKAHCSEIEWRLWLMRNINLFTTIDNNNSLEHLEKVMIGSYLFGEIDRYINVDLSYL